MNNHLKSISLSIFLLLSAQIHPAMAQYTISTANAGEVATTNSFVKNPAELFLFMPKDSSGKKSNKYKVDFGGVMQVHYLNEFNTNGDSIQDPDGFRILRARVSASGFVNEFISYELMFDLRAPEHNGIVRDAYIAFHFLPNQELRFGQQKTQFGYENVQSIQQLYVVNRSEMSDAISRGVNLRDNGLGLVGKIPLNKNWSLRNGITFTNGSPFNVTGPYDFSATHNGWGRLGLRYKQKDLQVDAGFSAGKGIMHDLGEPLDSTDDLHIKFERIGFDVEVEQKWFSLVGEYGRGTNLESDTLSDTFGYEITFAGKSPWKIGPLFRYDQTEDEFKRWTAGFYYGNPNNKFRVLINYEFRGQILDIPGGHDDRIYLQTQVRF